MAMFDGLAAAAVSAGYSWAEITDSLDTELNKAMVGDTSPLIDELGVSYPGITDPTTLVATDAANIGSGGGGSNVVFHTEDVVPAAGSVTVSHEPMSDGRVVSIVADAVLSGTNLAAGGTGWDPLNRSTLEAQVNNGTKTSTVYNNSSANNNVGWIIGVDLGSAAQVDTLVLYDWGSNSTYLSTGFEIISSDDGSTFNVLSTIAGHTYSPDPTPATFQFAPTTARYFGIRFTTVTNTTFSVISEIELYESPPTVRQSLEGFKFVSVSPTETLITDLSGANPSVAIAGKAIGSTTGFSPPPLIFASVESQDVNDNGPVTFAASARADAGWTHAASSDSFQYTGSPDRVNVGCMVSFAVDDAANVQRPNPVIELLRNGVVVASARTGYIRDSSDHEESSQTIVFTDFNPGADPIYSIQSRQESSNGGVVTSDLGHFSAEAILG